MSFLFRRDKHSKVPSAEVSADLPVDMPAEPSSGGLASSGSDEVTSCNAHESIQSEELAPSSDTSVSSASLHGESRHESEASSVAKGRRRHAYVAHDDARALTREKYVARAYDVWHRQLEDAVTEAIQKDAIASVALDLTHVHPTGAAQLYSGAATLLSSLIREERALKRAQNQLSDLRTLINNLVASYGQVQLSVVSGEARWSGVNMPMMIRSVSMDFIPSGDAKIQLDSAVSVYPQFSQALVEAGATPEQIAEIEDLIDGRTVLDAPFARLSDLAAQYLDGVTCDHVTLLGCYEHPYRDAVNDLEAMKPYILESGVMAALAGDEKLQELTAAPLPPGDTEDRAPSVERGVGDQDVDELHAVEAVASGRSIVIDCPPGTARLGAIVSVAADAAGSGRSVIIVPPHEAAGAALQREFDAAGVGELVVNFWDEKNVALRLRTGLRLEKPQFNSEEILRTRDELVQARSTLSSFVDELHRHDPKWGVSVHDVLEDLAQLTAVPKGPRTRVRFPEHTVREIDRIGRENITQTLVHAAQIGAFDGDYSASLWLKAELLGDNAVRDTISLVRELNASLVPSVVAQVAAVSAHTNLIPAQNPSQWIEQLGMLDGISDSLDTFLPAIFERSADEMVIATATKEWRDERGITMKNSERKMLLKQVDDLVRPGAAPSDINAELRLVQQRQELWRVYSKDGGWPILPPGFSQLRAEGEELARKLTIISERFADTDFMMMPWSEISANLAKLEDEEAHVETFAERNSVLKELRALGLDAFISDIKARHVPADALAQEFELACTSSVFEQLMVNSPVLASLGPQDVSTMLERMRELDTKHVKSLALPVMTASIVEMRSYARAHRDATLSVDAILGQYSSAAVKEAISAHSRIVQLARPVWIMPAGLMAQYLPAMPWADVCIIDASTDVSLPSVVAVLMRGRQAVIVGDTRRPCLLGEGEEFSGHVDERVKVDQAVAEESVERASEQEAELKGEQIDSQISTPRARSLVTACARVFPVVQLPTHRVQLNEVSKAALETHGYESVYQPIPINPRLRSAKLVQVNGRGIAPLGGDGSISTTAVEVDAVIDAIAEHALDRPHESLAVIALNERHATKIRAAYKKELAASPALQDFMQWQADMRGELFDIIDITHAAGVHRDHVILSVGFGKTVHGRLLHSFGVLAEPQGFLGLIDAIEAARADLTLVSSIYPGEIDRARISTPGPHVLADLLDAVSAGFMGSASGNDVGALAPLIGDLAARLEHEGWVAALDFGYDGAARIPLVAGHPDFPGVWAVAVLLDDDAYVAEQSLRRRDRHRIEAFEAAGWKVFQTYSTSLFVDPAGQARAVAQMLESVRDGLAHPQHADIAVPTMDETGQFVLDTEVESEANDGGFARAVGAGEGVDPDSGTGGVQADPAQKCERKQRPDISVGLPIVAYSDDELDDMIAWIASDRVPRSESQLLEVLRDELGIERRGGQIDLVLGNAVRRSGYAVTDAYAPATEILAGDAGADPVQAPPVESRAE